MQYISHKVCLPVYITRSCSVLLQNTPPINAPPPNHFPPSHHFWEMKKIMTQTIFNRGYNFFFVTMAKMFGARGDFRRSWSCNSNPTIFRDGLKINASESHPSYIQCFSTIIETITGHTENIGMFIRIFLVFIFVYVWEVDWQVLISWSFTSLSGQVARVFLLLCDRSHQSLCLQRFGINKLYPSCAVVLRIKSVCLTWQILPSFWNISNVSKTWYIHTEKVYVCCSLMAADLSLGLLCTRFQAVVLSS